MGRKKAFLLVAILLLSTLLVYIVPLGLAQSGTNVSGIISQDTTWAKAGSPYNLIGPVAVSHGAILTIEAGTTVSLGSYYMEINGTLRANQIEVQPKLDPLSNITFTSLSNSWNEQTGSGSIIENSNIGTVYIQSASPKINGSTIYSLIINGGHPIVTGNNIFYDLNSNAIASLIVQNGQPLIYNNSIGLAEISGGSPIISQNSFGPRTTISAYITGGSPTISNNIINGEIDINAASPIISNNKIIGQILTDQVGRAVYMHNGISISGVNNAVIDNNSVQADFSKGIYVIAGQPTIQKISYMSMGMVL